MKTIHRSILAATAALFASTAGAFAADLYGGSIKDDGGYVPTASSRPALFYARGDFTQSFNDFGDMTERPNFRLSETGIGNNRAWGAGLGYYFSPSVRGDLTLDWSNTATAHGMVAPATGATVQGERQFGVKHMVGLANLYYDFDTRTRFTPYLGVGVGFAQNTTTAGTVAVAGCGAATCSVTMDGTTKTNAAGAFMAGFSAKLHDRWSLDAGYRFLYLGDARTADLAITRTPAVVGAPDSTPATHVNDLYAHQVRVGLRMDLR